MAEKNKGGRPTAYKKEFCEKMVEFFDVDPYEDVTIPHYKNGELAWEDKKRMPCKLPTMVNFAKSIGVGVSTCYDWIDKNHSSYQPEFSDTYTHIAKRLQKDFLIQNGLQGLNNPVFAKFVAVNLTSMRDKVNAEHSGPDGVAIQTITRVIVDPEKG